MNSEASIEQAEELFIKHSLKYLVVTEKDSQICVGLLQRLTPLSPGQVFNKKRVSELYVPNVKTFSKDTKILEAISKNLFKFIFNIYILSLKLVSLNHHNAFILLLIQTSM